MFFNCIFSYHYSIESTSIKWEESFTRYISASSNTDDAAVVQEVQRCVRELVAGFFSFCPEEVVYKTPSFCPVEEELSEESVRIDYQFTITDEAHLECSLDPLRTHTFILLSDESVYKLMLLRKIIADCISSLRYCDTKPQQSTMIFIDALGVIAELHYSLNENNQNLRYGVELPQRAYATINDHILAQNILLDFVKKHEDLRSILLETNDTCSICLDQRIDGTTDFEVLSPCRHLFCSPCAMKWVLEK